MISTAVMGLLGNSHELVLHGGHAKPSVDGRPMPAAADGELAVPVGIAAGLGVGADVADLAGVELCLVFIPRRTVCHWRGSSKNGEKTKPAQGMSKYWIPYPVISLYIYIF